jgi:hypothetical protein
VLGDPAAGLDLDEVHAERPEPQRAAGQQPAAAPLELVEVLDRERLAHALVLYDR